VDEWALPALRRYLAVRAAAVDPRDPRPMGARERRREMAARAVVAAEGMAATGWRFQGEEASKQLDPQVRSALLLAALSARPPPLRSADLDDVGDSSWADHFARNRARSTDVLLEEVVRWLQSDDGFLGLET
jgi:hypothetical protein